MRSVIGILVLAACGGGSSSSPDAAVDAAGDTGAPSTTTVTATMAATRVLDHAFYGVNTGGSLHAELDKGGEGVCPTMSSPTPEYTVTLGNIDVLAMSTPAVFLDYQGDMLGGPINATATAVTLSSIVYVAGSYVAFDLSATFDAGTAAGHVYALHCASLDE